MNERTPLAIRYVSDEKGVFFGWSVRGRDQVDPSTIPAYTPETRQHLLDQGKSIPEEVHRLALLFFNGPLTADLSIPQNYPYEFYEPEKEEPTFTGLLRIK